MEKNGWNCRWADKHTDKRKEKIPAVRNSNKSQKQNMSRSFYPWSGGGEGSNTGKYLRKPLWEIRANYWPRIWYHWVISRIYYDWFFFWPNVLGMKSNMYRYVLLRQTDNMARSKMIRGWGRENCFLFRCRPMRWPGHFHILYKLLALLTCVTFFQIYTNKKPLCDKSDLK